MMKGNVSGRKKAVESAPPPTGDSGGSRVNRLGFLNFGAQMFRFWKAKRWGENEVRAGKDH